MNTFPTLESLKILTFNLLTIHIHYKIMYTLKISVVAMVVHWQNSFIDQTYTFKIIIILDYGNNIYINHTWGLRATNK